MGSDNVRSGSVGARLDVAAERQAERPALPRTEKARKAAPKAKGTATQTAYEPASGGFALGTLVPNNMDLPVRRAIGAVEEAHGDLDEYVARELGYERVEAMHGAFAGEQVDALGMALNNIERGRGFILGDQTGIGKGRVCAGIMRWAKQRGKIPVFVTMMPDLYVDMLRDLEDTGTPFRPFLTNQNLRGKDELELPDGSRLSSLPKRKYDEAMRKLLVGELPEDFDGIFTTYSQLSGKAGEPRKKLLRAINENVVFILDEAHNAGGQNSDVGQFMRGIMAVNPNGALYSSATYAKRPDVMSLYNKTDLSLIGNSREELEETMRTGGLAMQQVVSAMLTESGQYIRREKSFEGADMETVTAKVDLKVADDMADNMRAIMQVSLELGPALNNLDKALKREGKAAKENGATGSAGASSTTFSSVMHNLVAQTTLAIKADAAVEAVRKAVEKGQKPVLTLSNTMGGFIDDYAKGAGLKSGDGIGLSFGDIFRGYLRKSLEVKVKEPGAKKGEEKVYDIREMTEYDIPGRERIAEQAARVEELIDGANLKGLPVSPIDYIIDALGREGIRAGEITGREAGIHYDADGKTTYYRREAGAAVKVRASGGFNGGDLDCLIINRAGSTGISLHASEKFADRRRRNMIIVQPDLNIDVFMQTLGRVFRTGQVVPPVYQFLLSDMPSEKRPAAVLGKKMASLNANTTASAKGTQSFENIPDFLNMYGDQAAYELLSEDEELNRELGYPLDGDGGEKDIAGLAAKMTGRIPLLGVKRQEEIYERLESLYRAAVELADANGTNGLDSRTKELDARKLRSLQLTEAKSGEAGPFAAPAHVGEYDVKVLGRPFRAEEVRGHIAENKTPDLDELWEKRVEYLKKRVEGKEGKAAEAERKRVDDQWRHVREIIASFPVGAKVSLVGEGNSLEGFVTGILFTDRKEGGNPVAPSSWKMVADVADARRQTSVPFSRLVDGTGDLSGGKMALIHNGRSEEALFGLFDAAQSASREKRYIVTGNLVEGYNSLGHKGEITGFRNADGTVEMGIILPRNMDVRKYLEEMPVRFGTRELAERFLRGMGEAVSVSLQSGDGYLRLAGSAAGGYRLYARYKRAEGGRYYMDEKLLRLAGGDFVKSGQEMRSPELERSDIPRILSYLYDEKGVTLNTSTNREAAREITGESREFREEAPLASLKAGKHLPHPEGKRKKGGLGADVVQGIADRLGREAANAAPVRVVQRAEELPARVREMFADQLDAIEGIYDPASGVVWMVADNISDMCRAAEVWAHEQVGHHGLRGLFSDGKRRRMLNSLWLSMGGMGNETIRRVAEEYGLKPRTVDADRQTVMEEVIAHLAEKRQGGRLDAKEQNLWRKIVNAVLRAWKKVMNAVSGREGRMAHENIDALLADLGSFVWEGRGAREAFGFGQPGAGVFAAKRGEAEETVRYQKTRSKDSPNDLVLLPDGSADFGVMPETKLRDGRVLKGAPIRLQRGISRFGGGYGYEHINDVHGDEIRDAGYPGVQAFVWELVHNYNQIWQESNGALRFVKEAGSGRSAGFVRLTRRGDFYEIRSAFPMVNSPSVRGGKLLWAGDPHQSTATEEQNPFVTKSDRLAPTARTGSEGSLRSQRGQSNEKSIMQARDADKPLASLSKKSDRENLNELISEWNRRTGLKKEVLLRQLRDYFNVKSIDEIPVEWKGDAEAFVQEKIRDIPDPDKAGFLDRLITLDMRKTAALTDVPEIRSFFHEKDLGMMSNFLSLPHWIAKRIPAFAKVYERQLRRMDERSAALKNSLEQVPSLFGKNRMGKKDMESLGKILWETEGKEPKELEGVEKFLTSDKLANGRELIEINPDFYKAYEKWVSGLNGTEAAKKALVEVRKSLDNDLALAHNRMAAMSELSDDAIKQFRQDIGHIPNYFPHHRYGKYFVQAKVGDEVVFRQHFDAATKARAMLEAKRIAAEQAKNFPGAKWSRGDNVRLPDEVLGAPIDTEAMEQIIRAATAKITDKGHAKEIADLLMEGTADVLKARGWGEHGIRRKGVPGFEKEDLARVLYDYKAGLNGWLTKMEAARDFGDALRDIDALQTPRLWKYASQYIKDMLRNRDDIDRMTGMIKSVAFAWYLGGSIKTAMVNLTQNIVVGVPRLQMDVTGGAGAWMRGAHKAIANRVTGGRSALLTDEEARLLRELDGENVITDAYMEEIRGQLGSTPRNLWNRFTKVLGWPMSEVERFNRASLALAAFRAARAGQMKPHARVKYGVRGKASYEQAKTFAAEVVKDAHFVYGKSNTPEFLRSNAAGRAAGSMFTFRSFTFNMLGMWLWALRTQGREGAVFAAKSLGATMTLGGVTALPFYATAMALCQMMSGDDDDWTEQIRKSLPQNNLLRDMVCYGMPSMAGVNIGGSLQMETGLTRGLQRGATPKEILAESFGDIIGIPYDLAIEKPSKVMEASRHGDLWRMVEEAAPVVLKNTMQAWRLMTEGQTAMSGRPINDPGEKGARKLSGTEAVGKVLGFQPVSSTKSYAAYAARQHAEKVKGDMLDELTVLALRSHDTGTPDGKLEMRKRMRAWNAKMEAEGKPDMIIREKDVMRRVKSRRRENRITPKSLRQAERMREVWG